MPLTPVLQNAATTSYPFGLGLRFSHRKSELGQAVDCALPCTTAYWPPAWYAAAWVCRGRFCFARARTREAWHVVRPVNCFSDLLASARSWRCRMAHLPSITCLNTKSTLSLPSRPLQDAGAQRSAVLMAVRSRCSLQEASVTRSLRTGGKHFQPKARSRGPRKR